MKATALTLTDINDSMSDWDQHWSAFSNVVQIYDAYKSNALTKRVREQIGEESLSEIASTIIDKVKAFFKWLWTKIKTIFKKIKDFFVMLYRKIKRFLFGDSTGSKSASQLHTEVLAELNREDVYLSSKWHYSNICDVLETYTENFYPKMNYRVNLDHYPWVKEQFEKQHEIIDTALKPLSEEEEVRASVLSKCLEDVYSWVASLPNDFLVIDRVINDVTKDIETFQSTNLTEENVIEKLTNLTKHCTNLMTTCIDTVRWYNDAYVGYDRDIKKYDANLQILKQGLQMIICIANSGNHVYEKVSKWMCARFDEYNVKGHAINMKIKLPDFFHKHLEEHYGEKIDVGYIFITSLKPSTWDKLIGRGGAGWVGGHSSHHGHSECIWVNAQVILKDNQSYRDGFKHLGDSYSNANTALIKFIVHEFKHNTDYQHNRGEFMEGSNSQTDHDDRWEEKRAIQSEMSFEPTASEIRWASEIIDQVEREYYKK